MSKKVLIFLLLCVVATTARYFAPTFIANIFFIGAIIAYFYSKDEPFWLAFFLVISDGFMGFFGDYQAMLAVIPGLPPIEVGQFYIILATVKAWNKPAPEGLFYQQWLQILFVYVIFLVLQGHAAGVSLTINMQFKILKLLVPILLFFALPRLLTDESYYRACFSYLFPIALIALATQIFTISTAQAPPTFLGIDDPSVSFEFEVKEGKTYRGLFNTDIIIITQFGALFYLAYRKKTFPPVYLFGIVTANFLSCLLSATRGWTVSIALTIVFFILFVMQINLRRLSVLFISSLALLFGILSIPVVKIQIENAIDRMETMNAVAEGDLTAGGTLSRVSERGPRVMKQWAESPITGWGFSNHFFYYQDGHVGNQNILLHAGIIGGGLLALFFLFYFSKLYFLNSKLSQDNPARGALLVFIIIFLAWFFLHSTSRQYFAFYSRPNTGIIQALFFSMGGLIYYQARRREEIGDTADSLPVSVELNSVLSDISAEKT